jgi:hypothetical protein
MAELAIRLLMRTFERETRRAMIGHGKEAGTESVDDMARFAFAATPAFCELSSVRILMAGGAAPMSGMKIELPGPARRGFGGSPFDVALPASDVGMPALQRVGRLRVHCDAVQGGVKAHHVVASRAIRRLACDRRLSSMGIVMAARARLERRSFPPSLCRVMTALALHICMSSAKRKSSSIVVEGGGVDLVEVLLCVAIGALGSKALLMRILVARCALGFETEPRVLGERSRGNEHGSAKLRTMAVLAFEGCVLSLEAPAGFTVIELLRAAALPFHEIEVSPAMLGVAGRALSSCGDPMVAALPLAQRRDLVMARQASRIDRPASDPVAIKAVSKAFQRLMGGGERPGRDLGRGLRWNRRREKSAAEKKRGPIHPEGELTQGPHRGLPPGGSLS